MPAADVEDAACGEASIDTTPHEMEGELRMSFDPGADLARVRDDLVLARSHGVKEVDGSPQRLVIKGSHPTEERSHTDTTSDPNLPFSALGVAEPTVRSTEQCRHSRLHQLTHTPGEVTP